MNKLALVKRLCMEAGISTVGPTSTVGQKGEYLRVVGWLDAGYNSILTESNYWKFLRDDFSFPTIATISEYSSTETEITDVAEWIMDDIRIYSNVSDECELHPLDWDLFKATQLIGTARTTQQRPSYITEKPNGSLVLSPVPNAVYTCNGEYYKQPPTMDLDADEPCFDSSYHMAVVWRSLILSSAYSAEPDKYVHAMNEHDILMKKMKLKYLPKMSMGAPIA